MRNISKAFAGVVALDNVDLVVNSGECLALVGENGAGKSTLMKILSGVYQKDTGTIKVKGQPVEISSTRASQELGIAIIHQEFNLIEHLPVAANIFLGREAMSRGFMLNDRAALIGAQRVLDRLNTHIRPGQMISELTTGEKQLVEIARALSQNAQVLVMDEPTASLTKREIDVLFDIIRTLQSQGVSIVYISHRLEEIYEIAGRVVVLRNGKNAGEVQGNAPIPTIVGMMLGREIGERFHKRNVPFGDVALQVSDLSTEGMLRNIDLTVRCGEILGIFGIAGAGQRELAMSLFGLVPLKSGKIKINGREVRINNPGKAIKNGLGLLTESRKEDGLLLELSILENITLSHLNMPGVTPMGFISSRKEASFGATFFKKLNIRAPGLKQRVKFLSGGNQQKVVLARSLSTRPAVIILNEPTRGVDVGAKVEIYDLIGQLAEEGKGLIMISSELPEVLGLSDRVLVLYRGSISAELPRSEASQENLLTYAMGGHVVDGSK